MTACSTYADTIGNISNTEGNEESDILHKIIEACGTNDKVLLKSVFSENAISHAGEIDDEIDDHSNKFSYIYLDEE